MKKSIVLVACLSLGLGSLKAQLYTGYFYSNYEGVAGVIANPASIAGNVYKLDVACYR